MSKKRRKKRAPPRGARGSAAKETGSPSAPAKRQVRERLALVWALGVILAAATTIPYLYGWANAREAEAYTWVSFNANDTNQYLAWIKEGSEGHLAFGNRFTSEETPRILFKPLFLVMGLAAGMLGASVATVYHGARILLVLVLVRVLYWFASLFLPSRDQRMMAVVLTATAGGLGLLLEMLGYSFGQKLIEKPIDFWTPEAFVFQTMYLYPHLVAATALILVAVGKGWQTIKSGSWRHFAGAWAAAFVLSFIHPFDLVPVYAVLVALAAVQIASKPSRLRTVSLRVALIGLLSAPPAVVQTLLMRSHPTFLWILEHSKQTSLTLGQFLVGMGLPLIALVPVLLLGIRFSRDHLGKEDTRESLLIPLIYLVIILVLIFVPIFSLRRRFIMGVQVPLMLVLVWGTTACFNRLGLRRWSRWLVVALFWLLAVPGSALKMMGDYDSNLAGREWTRASYYHSAPKQEVYAWLENNSGDDDVVLTDWKTGNELPAYAGVRVFLGHWAHTVRYREKQAELKAMLRSRSPYAKRRLQKIIDSNGITKVLVLRERDRDSRFIDLARGHERLSPVFENSAGTVFKVLSR